jgi:hypothetical protein
MTARTTAAAAAIAGAFLLIYLPDIGHGFISDDFRWIVESRSSSPGDLVSLLGSNTGFYRPAVSWSFAADHALWGANAFGYGLTNIVLCLAAAVTLYALARQLGLPADPALAAVGVWLFNFHAVNMALLWLSGRTALLVSLFSLATTLAMMRRRFMVAGALALLAMLSKEEAVALPALFTAFMLLTQRRARSLSATAPLWAALGVYAALRLQSGAFWPSDAPSYYQFAFSPLGIGRNVLEYADRAGTTAAIVIVVLAAATRLRAGFIDAAERSVLIFAALWVAATYAITVFLPIRSSLYALLPSIGTALAAGVVAAAAARRDPRMFRFAAIGLILATFALNPVYRARNLRWVTLAELSEHVMTTIQRDAAERPAGHVVLIDAPEERFNLQSAFGALVPEAMRLRVGEAWSGEVVAAAGDAQRLGDLTYRLLDGTVRRLTPDATTNPLP